MATGTPFHERTAALNTSLNWRQWSGYFAAGRYNEFSQPEYAAIRNGVAIIDVSPLCKYDVRGPDAERLLDYLVTRDVSKQKIDQVIYTPWCDADGKVIQEGTILRFADDHFLLSSAEPSIRWLTMNAMGLDVEITDRSGAIAALAVQGPRSRDLLAEVVEGVDMATLGFFRMAQGTVGGAEVLISRTGYTGDLGYELWIDRDGSNDAPLAVWDALMAAGHRHGAAPCGILAMDVARVEAGFVMLDVDYVSAEHAHIPSQKSSPFEIGLGWAVKSKKKSPFIGRQALVEEKARGSAWQLVGLEIPWEPLEDLYAEVGLMPELPTTAWREAVPVYCDGRQVGRATSGCWSTLLKKYIALASVETPYAKLGSSVRMEVTVDYSRKQAPAKVVSSSFFRPPRLRG